MAQTVGATGRKRFTLTANQSQKVTLPAWARSYSVYVESVASVRVAPGDDAAAVEDSTSPDDYVTVGIGSMLIEPLRDTGGASRSGVASVWVHSTGAAVVVVSAYRAVVGS